jgi:hypothetical protein
MTTAFVMDLVHPDVVSSESAQYARLAADWWRWANSIPASTNPLAGGTDCSIGQDGHVWFLGGAFEPGTYERSCKVPNGRSLYFPIINAAYTNDGEDPPKTDAELHELASFWGSADTPLTAEMDGRAIPNLGDYHVHSDVFSYSWPDAPVFDPSASAGTTNAVTDGYYLLIPPLSRGEHTLHFRGSAVYTQEKFGFDYSFNLDVTYHLLVE